MNILVTGHITHLTKQAVKRLQDAGHRVQFAARGHDGAAAADAAWIIRGASALSLREPERGYNPLRQVLEELVALPT